MSTLTISLEGNWAVWNTFCSATTNFVSATSFPPVLWLRSWLGKSLLVLSYRNAVSRSRRTASLCRPS